jgi:hypothetical protein
VAKCKKGYRISKPMLCSGTTVGTREAVLAYFDIMYKEMRNWMSDANCCCFKMNGDDQSIHNYLYYTGQFDPVPGGVTAYAHRSSAVVNTIGYVASKIFDAHRKIRLDRLKMNGAEFKSVEPYDGANETLGRWLGLHYGLTDGQGYFTELDGSRSRVVHQYDRFSWPVYRWMKNNPDLWDPVHH